jgi:hypothetical protein
MSDAGTTQNTQTTPAHPATRDYLVISRGRWDPQAPKEDIQAAIDRFYDWLHTHIQAGRMIPGSRLGTETARVSKHGIRTDGPFGEAKEVIGGYWFIRAQSLHAAAALAAQNPCAQFGLEYEIRPLEPERATAFQVTNETPL